MTARHRVVIVGGGFGGLAAAEDSARPHKASVAVTDDDSRAFATRKLHSGSIPALGDPHAD